MCRERDADIHVLGETYNRPGKRPLILCQRCLGKFVSMAMIHQAGDLLDEAVTLTFAVAPARLNDPAS